MKSGYLWQTEKLGIPQEEFSLSGEKKKREEKKKSILI